MSSNFMTINDAAEYSGYSVSTLRYRRLNDLPPTSFKRGGRVMYHLSDLDAFLNQEMADTIRGRV